jgi:hypothetical protein
MARGQSGDAVGLEPTFQSATVRELQPVLAVIAAYVSPSASNRITRARRAASARPRRDRARGSSSVRCSFVTTSRVDGMRHRTIY